MKIIILLLAIILDGLLSLYIPLNSYFLPLFIVPTIYISYPLFKKDNKYYLLTISFIGFIYDQLFTHQLFLHTIIFLTLGLLSKKLYNILSISSIHIIIYTIILIIIYELLLGLILIAFRIVPVAPQKLLYIISHSLLLNIIYAEIAYLIIKHKLQTH